MARIITRGADRARLFGGAGPQMGQDHGTWDRRLPGRSAPLADHRLQRTGGYGAAGRSVGRRARDRPPGAGSAAISEWAQTRPARPGIRQTGRLDPDSVSGYDVVVHLAGAGIADGRWTARRKALIRDSRVRGTDLLARSLAAASRPPRVLVCASAVGFYGDRGDMQVDEGSAAGRGFLADTSRAWEAAARPAIDAGIRVVFLRIGIVLSPAGGALARMLLPYRMGLGGPLGDGRQYWSWIALDDLVAVVLHVAATEELAGPVNAVAPGVVRNADFSSTLGRVLRRPAVLQSFPPRPFVSCSVRWARNSCWRARGCGRRG